MESSKMFGNKTGKLVIFDIIDIDVADPQIIIFLLGVCVKESFPTKCCKIKTVGKFRKEIIDNILRMTFIKDAFFPSHEVQLLTSREKIASYLEK